MQHMKSRLVFGGVRVAQSVHYGALVLQ